MSNLAHSFPIVHICVSCLSLFPFLHIVEAVRLEKNSVVSIVYCAVLANLHFTACCRDSSDAHEEHMRN